MKKIAFLCIPAHGHTNPMIGVAEELVRRGDQVRFYSFTPFEEKIRMTGAEYISCDRFLGSLSKDEEAGLKRVSSTEMAIQDIRITRRMDAFLSEELTSFQPDVIFSDSVCFWGKLSAVKHQIPLVISTSTFAFNELSSGYIRNSAGELLDLLLGLPEIRKELKTLEPLGYCVNHVLSLIQSDNTTDNIVYTTRRFQPFACSFSDHYLFAGPSVRKDYPLTGKTDKQVIYISMGTVINERPEFYRKCINALRDLDAEIILSCGNAVDPASLNPLPENVRVFASVDQKEVLSGASLFLTHCGMNSVSESLFFGVPMILFPQTNEQKAVASRAAELGAGILLEEESEAKIRAAAEELLRNPKYAEAAKLCREDFLSSPGIPGAADFIEHAPHQGNGIDPLKELHKNTGRVMTLYYSADVLLYLFLKYVIRFPHVGLAAALIGISGLPLRTAVMKKLYKKLEAES